MPSQSVCLCSRHVYMNDTQIMFLIGHRKFIVLINLKPSEHILTYKLTHKVVLVFQLGETINQILSMK